MVTVILCTYALFLQGTMVCAACVCMGGMCGVWYGDGMVVDMEWVWLQVTGFKGQFNV